MDEFLTVEETLKILKVARSTLYRWVEEGLLTQYKIQKRVYFKRRDVEALFQPGKSDQPGEMVAAAS